MKISSIFDLKATQLELDFVDIDLDNDYPLFIDPFLISNQDSFWANEVDDIIKSFFSEFKSRILSKEIDEAKELFRFMSEPKETCLGLSKHGTTSGRGVGEINTNIIVENIVESNAIEDGIVNNIEDLMVFIEDIDRDKVSDMVTNIIRGKLIEYTIYQCDIWGIKTTKGETLPYWDASDRKWVYSDSQMLVIDGREIILVPKSFVSKLKEYSSGTYNWHFIVEEERNFHLRRRSAIVKMKKLKGGKEKYYLPKKDMQQHIKDEVRGEGITYKSYIRGYTIEHPELFESFIDNCKKRSKPLSNKDFSDFDDLDTDLIIDELIERLNEIPTGKKTADEYHKFVKSLIEIIFYPHLINPIVEYKIHAGRKRIDIVMDNNAYVGFFSKLHDISKIPCPYIFLECKNYGKDVGNPEVDQLAMRFSSKRGKFGFLLCRSIENPKAFLERCQNCYRDDGKLIIGLTDEDIISFLSYIKEEDYSSIDSILENRKREIILS